MSSENSRSGRSGRVVHLTNLSGHLSSGPVGVGPVGVHHRQSGEIGDGAAGRLRPDSEDVTVVHHIICTLSNINRPVSGVLNVSKTINLLPGSFGDEFDVVVSLVSEQITIIVVDVLLLANSDGHLDFPSDSTSVTFLVGGQGISSAVNFVVSSG